VLRASEKFSEGYRSISERNSEQQPGSQSDLRLIGEQQPGSQFDQPFLPIWSIDRVQLFDLSEWTVESAFQFINSESIRSKFVDFSLGEWTVEPAFQFFSFEFARSNVYSVNSGLGGPPTFRDSFPESECDQARGPHDGPPDSLIVPIVPRGGHPTFMAPTPQSEYDQVRDPRATRSTLSHRSDRWQVGEEGQHERDGAGFVQGRPGNASTNPYSSDCEKLPCSGRIPELIDLYSADVHRGFGPTRAGQVDNGEGFPGPTEGVSRVPTAEAAACEGGDSSPAHFIASPLHLITSPPISGEADRTVKCADQTVRCLAVTLSGSHPLSKDAEMPHPATGLGCQDLTEGASHWRGKKPQPGLGDPRLRDGNAGGDAGGAQKSPNKRGPLVGERQPLAVTHGSNPVGPVCERPGHQTSESSLLTLQVPLRGSPSGDTALKHPIFAAAGDPLLRPPTWYGPKEDLPNYWHRLCWWGVGQQ
jgi:hypothetical protein